MNKILIFVAFVLVAMTTLISACKEDATAEEAFLKKISGDWTASSIGVTVDGVEINGVFADFTLTVTNDGSFNTVNGNSPIWPATGSFTPVSSSSVVGFDLQRNDGVVITVEQLADQVLVLSFQYVNPNGRTSSVSGNYKFDLQRN
jgi:hypothetical protein